MKQSTFFQLVVAGVAATLLGTGCAPEHATAPNADAPSVAAARNVAGGTHFAAISTPERTTVPVVQRNRALTTDVSVTATISPGGGIVRIKSAGMALYFSPGAVSAPLTVTATANAGASVAYTFEPHGTEFHAPVYVVQDLQGTDMSTKLGLASTIAGAYMPDGISDLHADGTASVSELYGASVGKSRDPVHGLVLTNAIFIIQHFSGYILTGGRR